MARNSSLRDRNVNSGQRGVNISNFDNLASRSSNTSCAHFKYNIRNDESLESDQSSALHGIMIVPSQLKFLVQL